MAARSDQVDVQAFIDSLTIVERHHICRILNRTDESRALKLESTDALIALRDAYRNLITETRPTPNFRRLIHV